jgi:mannose-6-phosphate isomerase-like protein (cupin superfamily)
VGSSVQHSPAGNGAELYTVDSTATVKIDAEHTAGAYELFEVDAARLARPAPPHRVGWDCLLYCLAGRAIVRVDGVDYDFAPGASLNIPAGAAFMVSVTTSSARLLLFTLTGANGRLFADMDRSVSREMTPEEAMAALGGVIGRHDVSLADAAQAS